MMNQPIEMKEFSAESEFDWNLTILAKSDWDKNFIVMSDEVDFKEAGAKWSLQLSSCSWGTSSIFVVSRFFLKKVNFDKNAKFKFEILLKDGTILTSPLFTIMNPTFEYQMQQYIPVQEGDKLEITSKVTFFTLKFYKDLPPFALKGLNDALEAMNKADKEAEDVKRAFKALNDALGSMTFNYETQKTLEFVNHLQNELEEAKKMQEPLIDANEAEVDSLTESGPQNDSLESQIEAESSDGELDDTVEGELDEELDEEQENSSDGELDDTIEGELLDTSDGELDETTDAELVEAPEEKQDQEQDVATDGKIIEALEEEQDEEFDAELSEIDAINNVDETAKAFNAVLQAIIWAEDEARIVSAFSELMKTSINPKLAERLTEEAHKAINNAQKAEKKINDATIDVNEPQEDTDDADFDHCSDAEIAGDVQDVKKVKEVVFEEDFDHCLDVETPHELQITQKPQVDTQDEQTAKGHQKDAIKTKHSAKIDDMSDDDFDNCSENGATPKIYRSEATIKVHCHEGNCTKPPTEDEEDSESSFSIELPVFGKVTLPTSDPCDQDLLNEISNIYLENMKMIADASAALLIFAAKNENKKLLEDCTAALAAQMNLKNFFEIWQVGYKLKINELKDMVIKFATNNSFKAWYHQSISPHMMHDYVNSFPKSQ
ncbi:hypothetical protein ACKWTF_000908 [Chironomus riparius]